MKKIIFPFFLIQLLLAGQSIHAQFQKNDFWKIADYLSEYVFNDDNSKYESSYEHYNQMRKYIELYNGELLSRDVKYHWGANPMSSKEGAHIFFKEGLSLSDARETFEKLLPEFKKFSPGWDYLDWEYEVELAYDGEKCCKLFCKMHPGWVIYLELYNDEQVDDKLYGPWAVIIKFGYK